MQKSRVALFGAGSFAPPIIQKAYERSEIVAIADNDASKWTQTLRGLPIIPPAQLAEIAPDKIVISSTATFPIYTQLLSLGFHDEQILCPLTSPKNRRRWEELQNRHRGQRLFLVGAGPSLRIDDLDRIHEAGECSFAFNKIYLAFDQTRFRPDYYLVEDDLVAKNNREEIKGLSGFHKFYPDYLLPILGEPDEETTLFYFEVQTPECFTPKFADTALRLHSGYSCLFSAMQLALWMGFKEIVTLGLDFSFAIPKQAEGQVLTNDKERNHFTSDYRKPGERWNRPYLEQTRQAFQLARSTAESKGARILNASRSTQLDVFERVDLDQILQATR